MVMIATNEDNNDDDIIGLARGGKDINWKKT